MVAISPSKKGSVTISDKISTDCVQPNTPVGTGKAALSVSSPDGGIRSGLAPFDTANATASCIAACNTWWLVFAAQPRQRMDEKAGSCRTKTLVSCPGLGASDNPAKGVIDWASGIDNFLKLFINRRSIQHLRYQNSRPAITLLPRTAMARRSPVPISTR